MAFERVVNSDPRLEQERYFMLGYAIEFLKEHYDFILIDCLPSLGTMAVNAYAASDYVITPMEVGKFNRDSWEDVQDAISRVQRKTNPKLKLLGTFLTKDSPKTKISVQTKELFKEGRMGKLFRSSIRDNVAVKESFEYGLDIFSYDKHLSENDRKRVIISNGSEDYYQLTTEVLEEIGIGEYQIAGHKEGKDKIHSPEFLKFMGY